MANFIIPYTTPANYTYDDTKIEVDSGIAKLKNLTPSNESFYANFNSDINVSRGLGVLTGTAVGGASVAVGKLDLTGGSKSVNYDADLNADSQQVGTIRFKYTPDYAGYPANPSPLFVITKALGDADNTLMVRLSASGKIQILIQDFTGSIILDYQYVTLWNSVQGTEYEFELNYDLNTGATRLFIDGVQWGATQTATGIRDSNISFLNVGANYNNIQFIDGYIDDFQIFSTIQHTANYTPISIPENLYSSDSPTIYKTLGDGIANIAEFINFSETLGGGNEGLVRYQLSVDGVTWFYWDGNMWATANGSSDYNTASECNDNISELDVTEDKIYLKTFLISDGSQKVEIDNNQIGYVINTAPIVYAGTDKTSAYNTSLTPFSDCLFSDVEDNITKAEWLQEGGSYTEIEQGVYATLLLAVRAFTFSPTHSGVKVLHLQITDTYTSSNDVMVVTVDRVSITVNVQDSSDNHISSVIFTPGDSNSTETQNSPFAVVYDIGTHTYSAIKKFWAEASSSVEITIASTVLNVVMTHVHHLGETKIYIDFPKKVIKGDTIIIGCDVDRDITDAKIRASIYDKSCNEIKLACENLGGSDEIVLINEVSGEFDIFVDKDLTADFANTAFIEIEIEEADGEIYTVWQHQFELLDQNIDWTEK